MLLQTLLDRLYSDGVILVLNLVQRLPQVGIVRHPICNVFDVADDAVAAEVGCVDPEDLLRAGLAFAGTRSGYKVTQVLLPALLRKPLIRLALELAVDVVAV